LSLALAAPTNASCGLWDNAGMDNTIAAGVPVLETERLRLRPYREDDGDAVFALYSDPTVVRYWSFPAWTQRSQADAYLKRVFAETDAGEIFPWVVADRASDHLAGTLTLFSLHCEQLRAEIGYSLAPNFQGRGLASEALRCGLGYAFDRLGLLRIEADIDPRNEPSWRLLERLGFVREGLLRKRWRVKGEVCDTAFYGLLEEDFKR